MAAAVNGEAGVAGAEAATDLFIKIPTTKSRLGLGGPFAKKRFASADGLNA